MLKTMQSKAELIKAKIRAVGGWYFPKFASNYMFRDCFNRKINFKNPEYLDDKLMCLKFGLYKNNQRIADLADKIKVRDYVEECGLPHILIPKIAVYKSADEIIWEHLPEEFVIKCNHGCGYNIIVRNKNQVSEKQVKEQLNHWMKQRYGGYTAEKHYGLIQRGILCEKFIHGLGNSMGSLPVDYKFFCMNGKVECIRVIAGRKTETEQRFFTDRDFLLMDICRDKLRDDFDYRALKPLCLEKMIEAAEILSAPFPFVRVDLYDNNGQVLFGEMTFTPAGCMNKSLTDEGEKLLGKKLIL